MILKHTKMKKNIVIILIMTVALAVISVVLISKNTPSTIRKELAHFSVRDTASIQMFFLSDMNNNSVTIKRTHDNTWLLNDTYPVRDENIVTFFKTLIWIEVREPVPTSHLEDVISRLSAIATKVEIYQKVYRIDLFNKIKWFPYTKKTKTFYVGDATSDQTGTYMLMENSSMPFITYIPGFRGFLSTRFSPLEKDWRNPGIFNYRLNDIKSVQLDFVEYPEHSFKIVNNGDRTFALFNPSEIGDKTYPFDTLKVLNYMSSFDNVNFEALVNHISKKDSILKSPPLYIFSIELSNGDKNIVKTYKKWAVEGEEDTEGNPVIYDRDRMYALVNGDKDFVLIQYYVFDRILKPRYYFLNN